MSGAVLNAAQPILPTGKVQVHVGIRWAIGIMGLVFLVTAVFYVSEIATDPRRFPVTNVDVSGTLDYTDRIAMRERVQVQTQLGFYGMDVDAIRSSIESMPWVSQAHIRRVWPGRLMVTIEEHEPAARYNDNALISKSLELFEPPQLQKDNPQFSQWAASFASLPKLEGAQGRHESVLDAFRSYERAVSRFGVGIKALIEDGRHSQTLHLTNDITVRIGYDAHELRLQRFIDVYERLVVPLDGQPASFDMRYTNGFALVKGGLIGGTN